MTAVLYDEVVTATPAPQLRAVPAPKLPAASAPKQASRRLDNQPIEGDVLGQGGKPIFGRLGFVFRPLNQQPLLGARLVQLGVTMRGPHPLAGKA